MNFRMKYTVGALLLGSVIGLTIITGLFWFPFSSTTEVSNNPIATLTGIATSTVAALLPPPRSDYLEVIDSCGPSFTAPCVLARSGPSTSTPILAQLRNGMVLKIKDIVHTGTLTWYQVTFDEWLRYPERSQNDWYVAGGSVQLFNDLLEDEGVIDFTPPTKKRIIVDRSDQMLYAYEGDTLFMKEPVSTGLELTPTPRGIFKVFRKTPSRYMQGPLPGISDQYYDLPGVPWNLYFTEQGAVIHGAYWHTNFGQPWSHGCVNLPVEKAHELYDWAPVGTAVTVRD